MQQLQEACSTCWTQWDQCGAVTKLDCFHRAVTITPSDISASNANGSKCVRKISTGTYHICCIRWALASRVSGVRRVSKATWLECLLDAYLFNQKRSHMYKRDLSCLVSRVSLSYDSSNDSVLSRERPHLSLHLVSFSCFLLFTGNIKNTAEG